MENVVLYSTNCPKCIVLEHKLRDKGIQFSISRDMDVMHEKGFMSAPMLEVDNKTMNFVDAIEWLNTL